MAKQFNYRAFYEQETKTALPANFDVHHLDFNRENNDIQNLVAIPKELHKEFHMRNAILLDVLKYFKEPPYIGSGGKGTHLFQFANETYQKKLNEFLAYKACCDKILNWVFYRDFLLGKIHNYFVPDNSYSY